MKLDRDSGSTTRLLSLCGGYFVFYAIVTLTVKWFTRAGTDSIAFLLYQMIGGMGLSLGLPLLLGWMRIRSLRRARLGPIRFPSELLLIAPAGITVAVIGVTTTLMYTLPTSILVAMVLMRGGVIVIGRLVDAVQLRQGILQKKVYWEENVACLLGLAAVALQLRWDAGRSGDASAAMLVLAVYLGAYVIRIYLLNYYKHTRDRAGVLDQRGFFAVEQIFAILTLGAAAAFVYRSGSQLPWTAAHAAALQAAVESPDRLWPWAILVAGLPFGIVGFYSFFLFTFRGRTATFASLVNRLTSLAAGTAATVIWQVGFGGPSPRSQDWTSLAAIVAAAICLARAERRRAAQREGAETARDHGRMATAPGYTSGASPPGSTGEPAQV